jgi:hypothetical protein
MQATIKVQFVNQPKEGQRKGSIKGDDGNYYGVWPDKLSLFQKGQTYTIEYTESTASSGKTYRDFKRIIPGAPSTGNGKTDDQGQCGMFIMGVMGRCFQGTGNMPDQTTLTNMVRHLRKAWAAGMTDLPEEPPFPTGDGAPDDDRIPY